MNIENPEMVISKAMLKSFTKYQFSKTFWAVIDSSSQSINDEAIPDLGETITLPNGEPVSVYNPISYNIGRTFFELYFEGTPFMMYYKKMLLLHVVLPGGEEAKRYHIAISGQKVSDEEKNQMADEADKILTTYLIPFWNLRAQRDKVVIKKVATKVSRKARKQSSKRGTTYYVNLAKPKVQYQYDDRAPHKGGSKLFSSYKVPPHMAKYVVNKDNIPRLKKIREGFEVLEDLGNGYAKVIFVRKGHYVEGTKTEGNTVKVSYKK